MNHTFSNVPQNIDNTLMNLHAALSYTGPKNIKIEYYERAIGWIEKEIEKIRSEIIEEKFNKEKLKG